MGKRTLQNLVILFFCIVAILASVFLHFSEKEKNAGRTEPVEDAARQDREGGTRLQKGQEDKQVPASGEEMKEDTAAPVPEEEMEGESYAGIEFADKKCIRILEGQEISLADLKDCAMLYLLEHGCAQVRLLTIQEDTIRLHAENIRFKCEMDNGGRLLVTYSREGKNFSFEMPGKEVRAWTETKRET